MIIKKATRFEKIYHRLLHHLTTAFSICLSILNQIHAILQIKSSSDIPSKHHSKALKDANGEAISVLLDGTKAGAGPDFRNQISGIRI